MKQRRLPPWARLLLAASMGSQPSRVSFPRVCVRSPGAGPGGLSAGTLGGRRPGPWLCEVIPLLGAGQSAAAGRAAPWLPTRWEWARTLAKPLPQLGPVGVAEGRSPGALPGAAPAGRRLGPPVQRQGCARCFRDPVVPAVKRRGAAPAGSVGENREPCARATRGAGPRGRPGRGGGALSAGLLEALLGGRPGSPACPHGARLPAALCFALTRSLLLTCLVPVGLLGLRYYYSRKVILAYLDCALHTDMADIEQCYMKPPGESPGRCPHPQLPPGQSQPCPAALGQACGEGQARVVL